MKKINKIVNKFLQKKYNFERKYGQIEIGNINSRAAEVGLLTAEFVPVFIIHNKCSRFYTDNIFK